MIPRAKITNHTPIAWLRRGLRAAAFLFVVFCAGGGSWAKQLPVRVYSSANGLASSAITHIARDSKGFLWFSTRDGLSRFDGHQFINFRLPDLESSQTFRYFLESRNGTIWIAADAGLFRARRSESAEVRPLPDTADPDTRTLSAARVADGSAGVLFEDSKGRLWAGAGELALFEDLDADQLMRTRVPIDGSIEQNVFDISESPDGSIWVATLNGVARIFPDRRQAFYPINRAASGDEVYDIEIDVDGRIWFGQSGGAFVFLPDSDTQPGTREFTSSSMTKLSSAGTFKLPDAPGELHRFYIDAASPSATIQAGQPQQSGASAMIRGEGSGMWAAFGKRLYNFTDGIYRQQGDDGLLRGTTRTLVLDLEQNLWVGTNAGVLKLIEGGMVSYGQPDGIPEPQVNNVFTTASGVLVISHGLWRLSRFTGDGFESATLNMPREARFTWTSNAVIPDGSNGLYALSREGLFHFKAASNLAALAKQEPAAIAGQQGKPFYRGFVSRSGNIWLSTRGFAEQNGLFIIDARSGSIRELTHEPGYPKGKPPAAFAEDAAGNIWIGFYGVEGLLRISPDGRMREFLPADGTTRGGTLAILVDASNRLWVGSTAEGLSRVDDLSAEVPVIRRYSEKDGLRSNNVRSLTEGPEGGIYIGSVRGVDRLDPETGRIRHYSTEDGLAADFINAAGRDTAGSLWFGTPNGVSRLEATLEAPKMSPLVQISELEIAGERYSVSEFGQSRIAGLDLVAAKNNIRLVVTGVGSGLRFQYQLAGSANENWSEPSSERIFNFANLEPGTYEFRVKSVRPTGEVSELPAVVSFVIDPPFYRTWWFITLVGSVLAASVFSLDRYRVRKTRQVQAAYDELRQSERERLSAELALQRSREERLAELERVRARIATDLHDDIGSSLTQIAVLSQAVQGTASKGDPRLAAPLERIAEVSVELVSAMSDVVWAINPRRDNLRDLVQRMRRFAADVFTAKGIRFDFSAPDIATKLPLGANIRREVFAIYKEAVNNVVRHSDADRAEVVLSVSGDILRMQVSDDGKGFDPEEMLHKSQAPDSGGGNGLRNIERRGAELGGRCEVISFPGGGTSVLLEIPLRGSVGAEIDGTSPMAGENEVLKVVE